MWMPVMVSCKLGRIFYRSRDTATKTPVCLPTTVSSVSPARTDPHGKCRINFFPENKWWWWCNENCSPWAIYLMVKIARSYIVFFRYRHAAQSPPPPNQWFHAFKGYMNLCTIFTLLKSRDLGLSSCCRQYWSKKYGFIFILHSEVWKEAISGILVRHTVVHHPRSSEFAPSDSPYHANSY